MKEVNRPAVARVSLLTDFLSDKPLIDFLQNVPLRTADGHPQPDPVVTKEATAVYKNFRRKSAYPLPNGEKDPAKSSFWQKNFPNYNNYITFLPFFKYHPSLNSRKKTNRKGNGRLAITVRNRYNILKDKKQRRREP
ncbi:MAG: hypothetical protein IJK98_05280 [Clostridia bacterium]|nr:hypothetical protein [Clostridia bacterium]